MVHTEICADRAEWLSRRAGTIGGSDAACLLGMNPYKNNVELWKELTGQREPVDISDKPHVQYGISAEPHLRQLFALEHPEYTVEYTDNNIWTNDEYPFAHASLDGWITDVNGKRGILEIKTAEVRSDAAYAKWKYRIPQNYYCQCLWYLAVTGFDFMVLYAKLKHSNLSELVEYHIARGTEQPADIARLMRMGAEFWRNVQTRTEPKIVLPPI